MAGGHSGKPYAEVIGKTPFEEELKSLPKKCTEILLPHIKHFTTPDMFHDMVLCYYEAKEEAPHNISFVANKKIRELKKKNNYEYGVSLRTVYLDKCYSDSGRPLIEYFDPDNF